MVLKNNFVLEGGFSNGVQHGYGRCIEPCGNFFQGMFIAGEREGTGTLTFRDGHKLTGIWKMRGFEQVDEQELQKRKSMNLEAQLAGADT